MDQALPACMLLVVAALLLTNYPAAQAAVKAPQLSSAHDLVDWVVKYGGQTAGTVAQHPQTGLRGVFANRDIKKGEIAVTVPINVSMDIGPAQWTSAELAVSLLRTKVEYAQVWQLFQPYLGNLPSEEDVYTLYNFRQEHIALLQDAEMCGLVIGGDLWGCQQCAPYNDLELQQQTEGKVKQALDLVESIYSGTSDQARATMADLRQLRPEEAALITLGGLKRYASIIESYSFGAPNAKNEQWRFLVPLMDMMNHKEKPNVIVDQDAQRQAFVATALVDIRKGEELVQSYRERSNRNDIALLHHFFLNERRPALMCAHDFPSAAAHPTTQQPWTDTHYLPGGPLSTKEEASRLRLKLAAFPTTESQDRAALTRNRNPIRDWRERMIVEFRVLRKEKLRLVAEAIEEHLRRAEEDAAAAAAAAATAAQSASQAVVVDDDDDNLYRGSSSENSSEAAEGSQQGRGADRGFIKASDGKWRPQVVVPLADADVGLQEPKFLKINTAVHSEL